MTRLHLELLSDPALIAGTRQRVEAFAAAHGFDAQHVADVGLCVNEAIANIIRHAYDGATDRPIELDADMAENTLTITLRDWGNGRVPDLGASAPPDAVRGAGLRPGGLGLPCMKALLDTLHYQPQPDGMVLRLTKLKR